VSIVTRDQAVEVLEAGRRALDLLIAGLDDAAMTQPATIGGGDWSAKDLLGHLAFWEELAVDLVAARRAGRPPALDEISAAGDAGVDRANAANEAATAGQSLELVRARAAAAHASLLQLIRTLGDAAWHSASTDPNARYPTLGERLGAILGGEVQGPFGHTFDHLPDLRAYVVSLGRQ
jgi:DinB family protein